MKDLLEDSWIQVFLFLALVSGGLWAHAAHEIGPRPPIAAPTAAAASAAPSPLAAPGAPRASGPKAPGKWVVDARQALDADTATLGAALAAARDGETVYVRPGIYKESVVVPAGVSVIGLGATPSEVVISGEAGQTISISGGKVLLKNLTIAHGGPKYSKGLAAKDAAVELSGVRVAAAKETVGIDLANASLTAAGCTLESGYEAVQAALGSKVALTTCLVTGAETGVNLQGLGSSAVFKAVRFDANQHGLKVSEQAEATAEGCAFSRNAVAALRADRDAVVAIKGGQFSSNEAGVSAHGGSRVTLTQAAFTDNAQNALFAASGASISDAGSTISGTRGVGILATEKASLTLSGTQIRDGLGVGITVLDGASLSMSQAVVSGNVGTGLALKSSGEAKAAQTTFSGQKKCAIELDGASLILDRVKASRNECGLSFVGKASLQTDGSDFSYNTAGPAVFTEQARGAVLLRGQGNAPREFQSQLR